MSVAHIWQFVVQCHGIIIILHIQVCHLLIHVENKTCLFCTLRSQVSNSAPTVSSLYLCTMYLVASSHYIPCAQRLQNIEKTILAIFQRLSNTPVLTLICMYLGQVLTKFHVHHCIHQHYTSILNLLFSNNNERFYNLLWMERWLTVLMRIMLSWSRVMPLFLNSSIPIIEKVNCFDSFKVILMKLATHDS